MRDLHIIVNNKVATYLTRDGNIVCGNSDYRIIFTFDPEWNEHTGKMARFIWNGQYEDVAIDENNHAMVPVLSNTRKLIVGAYAENISSTAVIISCEPSVLCEGGTNV